MSEAVENRPTPGGKQIRFRSPAGAKSRKSLDIRTGQICLTRPNRLGRLRIALRDDDCDRAYLKTGMGTVELAARSIVHAPDRRYRLEISRENSGTSWSTLEEWVYKHAGS
jgi:hypothetical protein